MKRGTALENLTGAIIEICRSGLAPEPLRDRVLPRLRSVVPFDAAFWATVDPATLLFTRGHQQDIPPDTAAYFVRNEYAEDDVNRWTTLAQDRAGVRTLAQATAGDMERSARFREIFQPLGLGDELRAVFRVGGACWGCMCLHRQLGRAFTTDERDYVRRVAPHIAEAIRTSLLIASFELPQIADAPGLVMLGPDGSIISSTDAGERWLEELGWRRSETTHAPTELRALAAVVDQPENRAHEFARMQMRTLAGRWAVLHGSKLATETAPAIAVIIEEATPADLAPILMMVYGLTNRERTITSLICRGLSTRDIAERLQITPNTIQDHLKSIFDKTGVRTRRELAMSLLQRDYIPRTMADTPIGPSGFFVK